MYALDLRVDAARSSTLYTLSRPVVEQFFVDDFSPIILQDVRRRTQN